MDKQTIIVVISEIDKNMDDRYSMIEVKNVGWIKWWIGWFMNKKESEIYRKMYKKVDSKI